MAYKKTIVVTIKDGDGKVVAIDQMPLPPNSTTDLVSEIEIVDVPSRPRRDDRSPLSPDALRLADLRVGMHVKVCYVGYCSEMMSREGIITGLPRRDDDSNIVIPIAIIMEGGGVHHTTLNAAGMGLVRGKGGWDRYNYTLRIA